MNHQIRIEGKLVGDRWLSGISSIEDYSNFISNSIYVLHKHSEIKNHNNDPELINQIRNEISRLEIVRYTDLEFTYTLKLLSLPKDYQSFLYSENMILEAEKLGRSFIF